MKLIKKGKRGAVLAITSIILFVVTLTLSLFTTYVVVNRNVKVEYTRITKTRIALKNASFDVFNLILDNYIADNRLPIVDGSSTVIKTTVHASTQLYLDQDITVYYGGKNVESGEQMYHFTIKSTDFVEDKESSLKKMEIYTGFSYVNEPTKKTNYKIVESRYM